MNCFFSFVWILLQVFSRKAVTYLYFFLPFCSNIYEIIGKSYILFCVALEFDLYMYQIVSVTTVSLIFSILETFFLGWSFCFLDLDPDFSEWPDHVEILTVCATRGVPRGDAQDARASQLPPPRASPPGHVHPPPPLPEKRWGSGQQEKNASLFT